MDEASKRVAWYGGAIMNKNIVGWIVILILINVVWIFIADNTATQDINRPGAEFSSERESEVSSLFGLGPIPAEITCSFTTNNGQDLDVGYRLSLDGKTVASWSGNSSEKCKDWKGELAPGDYVFETTSFDDIDATISLHLQPFEPLRWYGHVILSVLLFVFGGAELFIRKILPERKEKESPTPQYQIIIEDTPPQNEGIWQDPIRPK
jgi:hypothetical protein